MRNLQVSKTVLSEVQYEESLYLQSNRNRKRLVTVFGWASQTQSENRVRESVIKFDFLQSLASLPEFLL